jgi:hypothetical protein
VKSRLYTYLQPESTYPYDKLKTNFLYQFLSKDTRREIGSLMMPNHLEPSAKNYEGYIRTILDYCNRHPEEEVVSI